MSSIIGLPTVPGDGGIISGGAISFPPANILQQLEETSGPFSRIIYNDRALDFPDYPQTFQPYYGIPQTVARTRSGKTETLYVPRVDCLVECDFRFHTDPLLQMQIRCWWAWAQQGRDWSFAIDARKTTVALSTVAALAGESSMTLNDATTVDIGERYLIRYAGAYQVVQVTGVAGDVVSFSAALDLDFPAGTVFRTEYFWSGVVSPEYGQEDPITIIPAPPDWFHFELRFMENLN